MLLVVLLHFTLSLKWTSATCFSCRRTQL